MADLPKSISNGTFCLLGVELHCHVLDDGRRIIDADDFEKLLQAMAESEHEMNRAELDSLVAWIHGGKS